MRRELARSRPLPVAFYERPSQVVARALLGAVLESHIGPTRTSGIIVETEAYMGPSDPASHAVVGLTPRTQHLFGRPGSSYVYFIYGVHWCINALTWEAGSGHAILIRALEPLDGLPLMRRRRWNATRPKGRAVAPMRRDRDLTNGPGKLCAALGIDSRVSGLPLQRPPVVIRRGIEVREADIAVSPRIGITKAADSLMRFFVGSSEFVSRGGAGR